MGHIALYREWRPKTFDEIVEQVHTVAALRQAVLSGKIAHAYLFSGTRGTGKTTMAQVFSRAINCLAPVNGSPCNQCPVCTGILDGSVLDVIEMDAASNNSVDTIRRLCDEIVFTPSITKYKVYIIDEVHMLSTGAFNALLKTLEEPPAHAVFILATTEQHRIPATILSRCQRYEFRRIPIASIVERLRKIADADGISIQEDALKAIAQLADGALRDAISLLDQAKGSFQGTIEKEDVLSLVGVVNDEFMNQMALAIVNKDPDHAMRLVEEFVLDGRDVIRFTMDLAAYFRNIMICKVSKKPEDLLYVPAKTINGMKKIASFLPLESILSLIRQLSALVSDLRWSLNTRITFEIAIIRLMDSPDLDLKVEVEVETKAVSEKPAGLAAALSKEAAPVAPEAPVVSFTPVTPAAPILSVDEEDSFGFPSVDVADKPSGPLEAAEGFLSSANPIIFEPLGNNEPPMPPLIESETNSEDEPGPEPQSELDVEVESKMDIDAVWPKILDSIISAGQMTVYLFLLPAKPVLDHTTLRILFEDKDHVNYNELSTKHNHQIISQAVFKSTGFSYTIILGLQSEEAGRAKEASSSTGSGQNGPETHSGKPSADGSELSKLDVLKQSAEELGISFYMEE